MPQREPEQEAVSKAMPENQILLVGADLYPAVLVEVNPDANQHVAA